MRPSHPPSHWWGTGAFDSRGTSRQEKTTLLRTSCGPGSERNSPEAGLVNRTKDCGHRIKTAPINKTEVENGSRTVITVMCSTKHPKRVFTFPEGDHPDPVSVRDASHLYLDLVPIGLAESGLSEEVSAKTNPT